MNLDPAPRDRAVGALPLYTRAQRGAAWLIGAVMLAGAAGLLLVSPASARERRGRVRAGEIAPASEPAANTPGESTPGAPGESTPGAPGESTPGAPSESTSGAPDESTSGAPDESTGGGDCQVAISEVAPSRLTVGESSTVVGSLTCADPTDAGEQSVAIYQHTAGTRGYSLAGTATTEPSGAFHFTSAPLEANSSFYASADGTRSQRAVVRVSPVVTISELPATTQVPFASARPHPRAALSTAITFTGTVTPTQPGARVVLQSERVAGSGHWRRLGVGQVAADGTYSFTYAFAATGVMTVRAIVHARGFPASASEPISFAIAPSRGYKVRGAHRTHSVTQLEGVRPVLTAQVSASTLRAGEALTFSGTITPDCTGRAIYLERQVHGGIGFQVVKVGVVSVGSTFTLQATPQAAGTQVFRVKLAAGSDGQTVVSEPFTIQVMSATALR